MPAPIVYMNARDIPIPHDDLYTTEDTEDTGSTGHANALVRSIYREAGQDDGTMDGTLWEREAERATLAG